MPKGYTPFEPIAKDSFTLWAKKLHQKAFTERRIQNSVNAVVSHTSRGVHFTRKKP